MKIMEALGHWTKIKKLKQLMRDEKKHFKELRENLGFFILAVGMVFMVVATVASAVYPIVFKIFVGVLVIMMGLCVLSLIAVFAFAIFYYVYCWLRIAIKVIVVLIEDDV